MGSFFIPITLIGRKKRVNAFQKRRFGLKVNVSPGREPTQRIPIHGISKQFGNSEDDMLQYISKNLKYPKKPEKKQYNGKVLYFFQG